MIDEINLMTNAYLKRIRSHKIDIFMDIQDYVKIANSK